MMWNPPSSSDREQPLPAREIGAHRWRDLITDKPVACTASLNLSEARCLGKLVVWLRGVCVCRSNMYHLPVPLLQWDTPGWKARHNISRPIMFYKHFIDDNIRVLVSILMNIHELYLYMYIGSLCKDRTPA